MQNLSCIESVVESAKNEMIRLAYSKGTIFSHEQVWETFRSYAKKRGETLFTAELAERFLEDTFDYPEIYSSGEPMPITTRNQIRSIRILQDFHFLGTLPRKLTPSPKDCPKQYRAVYEQYKAFCTTEGRTERVITNYARTALEFIMLLVERNVACYADICTADVDAFIIRQQGYTKHTVKAKFRMLKIFLGYLHCEGHTAKNFCNQIPRVRIYAKSHIPATLSKEQVNQLVASCDRGSPIGKRDYAILLLAYELGLRSSDISNLQFDNIDWAKKCIRIIQEKTENALDLPISTTVTNAIIEYLKYGRPKTKVPYVFVQHIAPYGQYSALWNVMQRALTAAGIQVNEESTKGLHLLRHTLGTNLLKSGVPLSTIAEILGQRDIVSTEIYLHTDTEGLRKCALDPEVLLYG